MLVRCSCGKYTNYGSTCVTCAMAVDNPKNDENVDLDDLFMDEEEEEEFNRGKDSSEDPQESQGRASSRGRRA